MSKRRIEVVSIMCDGCNETGNFVLHDEHLTYLQMEKYRDFIDGLRKDGWIIGETEGSDLCYECKKKEVDKK